MKIYHIVPASDENLIVLSSRSDTDPLLLNCFSQSWKQFMLKSSVQLLQCK